MNIYKLALRYFLHFKSSNKMIFMLSIIGLSVGVASILISSAIMRGFENILIEKTIMLEGHIKSPILCRHNNIKNVKKCWDGRGVLSFKGQGDGIILKAWGNGNNYLSHNDNQNEKTIAIGKSLAKKLNIKKNDNVEIVIPIIVNGELITSSYECKIANIITTGMSDFDEMIVILPWKLIQNNGFSASYEYFVHDINQIVSTASDIPESMTWMERHENMFNIIKIERRIVNLILSILLILSGMSIFSNIQIILQTRTRNIFILKVLGMKNRDIRKIFVIIGLMIGFIGTIIGSLITLLVIYNPFLIQFIFDTLFYGSVSFSIPKSEIYCVILFHILLCVFISRMPNKLTLDSLFRKIIRS